MKKKWIVILIAVIVVFVAGLVIWSKTDVNKRGATEPDDSSSSVSADTEEEEIIYGEINTDDSSLSDSDNGSETQENRSDISENDTVESSGDGISFPYTASVDELELIAVYNYSGYYIEDGTEDEVDSVAVLEVANLSDNAIEYAEITLDADGETLTFQVSLLPAGETVLVMEADRKSCGESAAFTYGGCEAATLDSLDLCEDQVTVTTDGSGAITVENISGEDISELRLFYKNRLDEGEYVGGIAYTVKLEDLAAGESQTVYPSHFDPEYGVVMMVRTY